MFQLASHPLGLGLKLCGLPDFVTSRRGVLPSDSRASFTAAQTTSNSPETNALNTRSVNGTADLVIGLRGLAALIVFNWHVLLPFYPALFNPYATSNPNSAPIQLPFVRMLVAGVQVTQTFALLSGYVQSTAVQGTQNSSKNAFDILSPPLLRRTCRIILSILPITTLQLLLSRLDVFKYCSLGPSAPWFLQDKALFPVRTESLTEQLKVWSSFNLSMLNITSNIFLPNSGYGPHLWTIPFDMRSAAMLYVLQCLTFKFTTSKRLYATVAAVALSRFLAGDHHLRNFVTTGALGCLVGQVQTLATSPGPRKNDDEARMAAYCRKFVIFLQAYTWPIFISSLYFASLPLAPAGTLEDYHPLLRTNASASYLGITALSALLILAPPEPLRKLLLSDGLQRMGHLSFSFYLVHNPVIQLLAYPSIRYLKEKQGWQNWTAIAAVGFVVFHVATDVAKVFQTYVEQPIARFARKIAAQILS